jgi:hypothetical protein
MNHENKGVSNRMIGICNRVIENRYFILLLLLSE